MKKLLLGFVFIVAVTAYTLHAQVAPAIEWQKCLGGSDNDTAFCIQQTFDGGFIIAGSSISNDSDVTANHGGADYWIVKTDTDGNIEWQKCLGGSSNDEAHSIQQTSDGGFIVAGSSASVDGDITGNHGLTDYWIIKLDAVGNLEWQKCLGGSENDNAYSIQQTSDDGYIVAGGSYSNDGDVSGNHGSSDYWIVKLDIAGNLVWQKCLGGLHLDFATSILEKTDNGFIITGNSSSPNVGDVSGHHGSTFSDFWIVKLDLSGNLDWQKCLGSWQNDYTNSICQVADGFIIAGYSAFNDGDVTENHGSDDYWIVKIDTSGNLLWQKSLGGTNGDRPYSIREIADGGLIVAGASNSNDGDVSGRHGIVGNDEWILKLSADGNLIWQKMLGGFGDEIAYSIIQTSDERFIIAGSTNSHSGDVIGNHGNYDYWIVKLSRESNTGIASLATNFISVYPNPIQDQLPINLTTSAEESIIRVYDLHGRMIALPNTFTSTQALLNTTSLTNGFYTLQITNNSTGESQVGKFVKQE